MLTESRNPLREPCRKHPTVDIHTRLRPIGLIIGACSSRSRTGHRSIIARNSIPLCTKSAWELEHRAVSRIRIDDELAIRKTPRQIVRSRLAPCDHDRRWRQAQAGKSVTDPPAPSSPSGAAPSTAPAALLR